MADYQFKINSLSFKCSDQPIVPKKINVIIGPNNSGKSRALKEIRSEILGHPERHFSGPGQIDSVVFDHIDLNMPASSDDLISSYSLGSRVVRHEGGWRVRDYCNMGKRLSPDGGYASYSRQTNFYSAPSWIDGLDSVLSDREAHGGEREARLESLEFFGPCMVDYAGTEDRLLLSVGERAFGHRDNDYNILSSVLDYDPDCAAISADIYSLFEKDVVLDAVSSRQLVVPVVSDSFEDYRATTDIPKKLEILEKSTPLSNEGDGFRSFVSVLLSVIGRKKPIFLLDEPEAFLHPPYARRMGELLAKHLSNNEQLESAFISTHSSYLLQGLLSGDCEDVQIVRLERTPEGTSAKVIGTEALQELINRKNYSPKYLDGLFSSEVNLVEGPWDESVYSRIIMKVDEAFDGLFIPTNGKDAFPIFKKFYSNAGIKCRVISDFDLLNNKDLFNNVMTCFLDKSDAKLKQSFLQLRQDLEAEYRNLVGAPPAGSGKLPAAVSDCYKNDVEAGVGAALMIRVKDMIRFLGERGLVILKTGELESMFVADGIEYGHQANSWFQAAMEYIAGAKIEDLRSNSAVEGIVHGFGC